jgi:hypothetical protein
MPHERDPLDPEQELAKTQMPGHPLRMPAQARTANAQDPRERSVATGPFTARTTITSNQAQSASRRRLGVAGLRAGHVAASAQSDLIWLHRLVIAEVPPTGQNGGSVRRAVVITDHAAWVV